MNHDIGKVCNRLAAQSGQIGSVTITLHRSVDPADLSIYFFSAEYAQGTNDLIHA